jgi:hypothetical protein
MLPLSFNWENSIFIEFSGNDELQLQVIVFRIPILAYHVPCSRILTFLVLLSLNVLSQCCHNWDRSRGFFFFAVRTSNRFSVVRRRE